MPLSSPPVSRARLALILGGLAMIGPFSIDTLFPAFPQIGAQFDADKVAILSENSMSGITPRTTGHPLGGVSCPSGIAGVVTPGHI